jgi:hypothetical protein
MTRPLPDFDRGGAALMNDLIKAAIEPGQSFSDAVGCLRGCRRSRCQRRRSGTRLRIGLRHAFELSRQRIKTLVDGSEIFADVLVVIRFPV